MWVSKSHPNPPRKPEPPPESGERLATFSRPNRPGDGKLPQELRVSLDEYQGHRFVALRMAEQNADGQWWPVKGKTLSVRAGELDDVIEALCRARDMIQADAPPAHRPESRGPSARATQPGERSMPSGTSFDEDRPTYQPPRTSRPKPRDPNAPGPGYSTPSSSDQPFDEFA